MAATEDTPEDAALESLSSLDHVPTTEDSSMEPALEQFVARVRIHETRENWYDSNFTMSGEVNVDKDVIRTAIEATEEARGEMEVEFEGVKFSYLFVKDEASEYWAALRAAGTYSQRQAMLDAILKLHSAALKPVAERSGVDFMEHWTAILGSYASEVEIVEDIKQVFKSEPDADATAADAH